MIDLKLKSNIEGLKEDLGDLLLQLKTKSSIRSNEVDRLIGLLFEKHFFNSDYFFENYYRSFKNKTFVGIWYLGKVETNEEKRWLEESEFRKKVNFIEHFFLLTPYVNAFQGKKSNYRNRPDGFSNLAFYFLLKLAEFDPEYFFPIEWVLFAEGIEISNKLKHDLNGFLLEKELVELDMHNDYRISYKGRLFIEEKSLNHG